tara:strand:+ start:6791 stop:7234 length:444 start_codon:yes stop_codon:yes gene_type:complete
MILISHRGNVNGTIPNRENTKVYIQDAIDLGYDVEVDIRFSDGKFWLGHDTPQYEVGLQWLLDRNDKLWVHCKNFQALTNLINTKLKVFYHTNEEYTIISNLYIWAHNIKNVDNRCIVPLLSRGDLKNWKSVDVHGICSDYVGVWND